MLYLGKVATSVVKYLLFFILGVVVAAFVTVTAVSYYAVEHLTLAKPIVPKTSEKHHKKNSKAKDPEGDVAPEDSWVNSNILDVLRLGDQYAAELNQFDELKGEIAKHKAPPLCEVICNGSFFEKDRMLEERTPYLRQFYRQNGDRAFQDPLFQLKLREVGFLAELFPASFRTVWMDVGKNREANLTFSQKLSWSLQFEIAAVAELSRVSSKWDEMKKESDRIQNLRDIIQSCQKGLRPAKDLRKDCQQL